MFQSALRLAAGHRSDDEQRLGARGYRAGQRFVGRSMREIALAGEKSYERPALVGRLIANRSAQHGVPGFERIEHRTLRRIACNFEFDLAFVTHERTQMSGQHDADQGSVWTSTESTAGRSCTIGVHVSPASGET